MANTLSRALTSPAFFARDANWRIKLPSLRGAQRRSNHFSSLPGLTRQSILFEKLFRSVMDARVKPAHDEGGQMTLQAFDHDFVRCA
jgi:hypothetical protein